jgi:peptidoglycan/LPS O-acetylase OafA/YrhL
LDGLRGIAVMLVVTIHAASWLGKSTASETGLRTFLDSVGWMGVDLFFVLSGFLITGILCDSKGKDGYFWKFYGRRTVRIFPLYYLFLFLMLIVAPALSARLREMTHVGGRESLWYWFYGSNILMSLRGGWIGNLLDVTWSLAIEEQFYLIWPLLIFLLSRRAALFACAGMMAFALAFRIFLVQHDYNSVVPYTLTPARIDTLAIGALIALLLRSGIALPSLKTPALCVLIFSAAGIAGLAAVTGNFFYDNPLVATAGFTLAGLMFGAVLVLSLLSPPESKLYKLLTNGLLQRYGKYSYCIYLVHCLVILPIGYALAKVSGTSTLPALAGSSAVTFVPFLALIYAVALGVGALSWNLYEKHFLKLKAYMKTE